MSRTLLILAGGTGGHIMPGLAVARALQARGWNIRWLGTTHGMENRLVPEAGIQLQTVAFSGLRGKGAVHALKGAWLLVRAAATCMRIVKSIRPDAVLGMGGYVTVPGGVSAFLRRRPLVLMNCDARLLLSNRILLPFARRILFGLPGADAKGTKATYTGNPVRADIVAVASPELRYATRFGSLHLLVVGGSLGASVLNRTVPEAIALMPAATRPHVVHQTGVADRLAVAARYAELGIAATVLPFIDDMALQYATADLVICRAGANTVSELTSAGIASLLVPLTVSTTSHQRDNAVYLRDAGASHYMPQDQFSADRLAAYLGSLDRAATLAMARAARALGKSSAAQTVADHIEVLSQVEQAT